MTEEELFTPIPDSRTDKVRCRVCGRTGYPDAPWQDSCRKGHPFICSFDGRRFSTKSALQAHRRHPHPGL